MGNVTVNGVSGITFKLIRQLLMAYESRTEVVLDTEDCYYLEFKTRQTDVSRFFAAVQRRDGIIVLRLYGLLHNPGITGMLSGLLLQVWDGNYSFIFRTLPQCLLTEIDQLLYLSLQQGYSRLSEVLEEC